MASRLDLTREQVLAFRRRTGELEERLELGADSLQRAAWAGLQDSVPRSALLSIHARVAGTGPATWEHQALAQLWGPRYCAFVVAARDLAFFSLSRMPEDARGRRRAEELATRLAAVLNGSRMSYVEAGHALGVHPFRLRYAAATGTVLIRWEGARVPQVWTVPPPEIDPLDARLELARRYLHIYGPSTAESFAEWAGISRKPAEVAFEVLGETLLPVRTPAGDGWLLAEDEETARSAPRPVAPVRLLPSGDPYCLLWGADRDLLVPEARLRSDLWTSRVWPGGVLLGGEMAGTWRRSDAVLTVQPWREYTTAEREAIVTEAESLPLPGAGKMVVVRWAD
jgi:hypothetical protein